MRYIKGINHPKTYILSIFSSLLCLVASYNPYHHSGVSQRIIIPPPNVNTVQANGGCALKERNITSPYCSCGTIKLIWLPQYMAVHFVSKCQPKQYPPWPPRWELCSFELLQVWQVSLHATRNRHTRSHDRAPGLEDMWRINSSWEVMMNWQNAAILYMFSIFHMLHTSTDTHRHRNIVLVPRGYKALLTQGSRHALGHGMPYMLR